MQHGTPNDRQQSIARRDGRTAADAFFESILGGLTLHPALEPLPPGEDHAHPTVRAMQRARRQAWLHARHVQGWSMFRAIRVSQRLTEAFAAWSRGAEPSLGALRAALDEVGGGRGEAEPLREHLRFLDSLMDSVRETGASREEFDLAREALLRTEHPRRAAG